ncbi:unconventional myosin-XVI-like [Montipora capricornis]|uniref:unconventional myosin-XVI-like n=1 Tax=Montipora capricornis TaxID=246305 RepID=UPI0035F14A8D
MARLTRRDKVADLLKQAIGANDVAKLKFALKYQQAKINEQDENGETVLHQSCLSGQLEIVRLLVENGAELELRDDRGWTCLHYAAFGGCVDVVNFLINSCVDVTATSLEGKLAIDVAKGEGIVFLLATAILRAGKEHLLLRYMDESTSSLQSVESETSEEDRHNWSPIHGSLSEEVLRASQQFLGQSFGAYLDEKFNLKSSFDNSRGEAELPAKENGTRTRKTSCPGGQNDTQGLLSPFKRPRLNSFNSAFSRDVLQRFAVSESDLTEEQVGEKEKRADINRAPNFSDLNNVNSDTLI